MHTLPKAFMVALFVAILSVPYSPAYADDAAPNPDALAKVTPTTLMDVFLNARAYLDEAQDAPSDTPMLGLTEVVQRAIEHSGKLLAAEELVVQREAQSAQVAASRKPQVGANFQLAYLGALQQDISITPLLNLVADIGSLQLGDSRMSASVQAQQVLYAGGKISAGIRATRHLTESEKLQRQAALTDVALEATRAYYQSLLAKAIMRVARESAETYRRHLGDANKALEVGAVSRFEVIRAQTETQVRDADVLRAKTGDDVATLNLRRLTGIEGDGPLYLKPDWFTAALPTEQLDALVKEGLENRPELNALKQSIDAAKEQVSVKKGDHLPTVATVMQYQKVEGGGGFVPQGFSAALALKWDIYTGGKVKNSVAEAKSQVRMLEHQHDELERAVELDVRQAWLRSREAAQRILMQYTTVELAREGQSLADLRFQQGAGTQSDTLDADLALGQTRTALVQALGDYFLAQADLAKASGRGWQENSVGAPKEDAVPTEAVPVDKK